MKKLFLIFGALFAFAGCADDSGSNGINTETCPITSADFTYERIKQNQYQIKLDNESKRQYENNIKWIGGEDLFGDPNEYDKKIEPLIIWENGGYPKDATFYYNNNQCGETITLKPKSTYSKCDDIAIDYIQDYANYNATYRTVIFRVHFKSSVSISLDTELRFDNGVIQKRNATSSEYSHQFIIQYDSIKDVIKKYNGENVIYTDVIIKYSDNTECVKELKYDLI